MHIRVALNKGMQDACLVAKDWAVEQRRKKAAAKPPGHADAHDAWVKGVRVNAILEGIRAQCAAGVALGLPPHVIKASLAACHDVPADPGFDYTHGGFKVEVKGGWTTTLMIRRDHYSKFREYHKPGRYIKMMQTSDDVVWLLGYVEAEDVWHNGYEDSGVDGNWRNMIVELQNITPMTATFLGRAAHAYGDHIVSYVRDRDAVLTLMELESTKAA